MKFFCGYGTMFFYNPFFVKKILVFFTFCFITQYTISAQHTKTVIVSKDSILYNSTIACKPSEKLFSLRPEKEKTFLVGQKIAFTPNTAAINARYNSAKNPLLLWKYAYPLTPEEIVRREDRKKEEEKIVNQVLKTIFSKKKNIVPVSPAF